MQKTLSIAFIISIIFLSGCNIQQIDSKRIDAMTQEQALSNLSWTDQINKAFKTGATLTEIQNPNLNLPSDIHPSQIMFYFEIGNIFLAPVLKSSMNVYLENKPLSFITNFSGLLIADKNGRDWQKFLEIRDVNPDEFAKNNPYYLWEKDNLLAMSVVDQIGGGGSGEGNLKVFILGGDGNWYIDSCYNFWLSQARDFKEEGEYFRYAAKTSELSEVSKATDLYCQNAEVVWIHNDE